MLSNKVIRILSSITNNVASIQQLQVGYWFGVQQAPNLQSTLPVISFFAIAFLLGAATFFYNRLIIRQYEPKNRVLQPFSIGLIVLGLSGAGFTFLRYLRVSFLGTRFFIAVFVIIILVWSSYFIYLWRKKVPSEIIKYETRIVKKRYLRKSRA